MFVTYTRNIYEYVRREYKKEGEIRVTLDHTNIFSNTTLEDPFKQFHKIKCEYG